MVIGAPWMSHREVLDILGSGLAGLLENIKVTNADEFQYVQKVAEHMLDLVNSKLDNKKLYTLVYADEMRSIAKSLTIKKKTRDGGDDKWQEIPV